MNPQLFAVEWDGLPEYAEVFPIDVEYDYSRFATCPVCNTRVSGGYWLPPREVVLTKRNAPDFLYTVSDTVSFVISEKALQVIRAAGLTGVVCAEEIEHVRFQRKGKDTPIPKYYRIELVRSRMTIDHENSKILYGESSREDICPLCHPICATYHGYWKTVYHTEEYEGYDIFHTYELGGRVFLSQRFVDVYLQNGLTNLNYVPAEEYGREDTEYFFDGGENT